MLAPRAATFSVLAILLGISSCARAVDSPQTDSGDPYAPPRQAMVRDQIAARGAGRRAGVGGHGQRAPPNGILVAPAGPASSAQQLVVIHKDAAGRLQSRSVLPVRFVPMVQKPQPQVGSSNRFPI
jgi:Protein-L-isoaspartate(D-aspartate) O-methyltransferase (PCMT)